MTDETKPEKKKTHIALRNLCTSKGNIKKGESFKCSANELKIFKAARAV